MIQKNSSTQLSTVLSCGLERIFKNLPKKAAGSRGVNSGGGRVGAAAREMGKMRVALTLLILLGVSSCKEQPVEQQPGYKFGLADGKTIGYGEGRDQMKAEMCKRIRESDDRIHTQLQRNRICE